jgi:hypothetical protein
MRLFCFVLLLIFFVPVSILFLYKSQIWSLIFWNNSPVCSVMCLLKMNMLLFRRCNTRRTMMISFCHACLSHIVPFFWNSRSSTRREGRAGATPAAPHGQVVVGSQPLGLWCQSKRCTQWAIGRLSWRWWREEGNGFVLSDINMPVIFVEFDAVRTNSRTASWSVYWF